MATRQRIDFNQRSHLSFHGHTGQRANSQAHWQSKSAICSCPRKQDAGQAEAVVNLRRAGNGNGSNLGAPLLESVSAGEREVLNEGTFKRMISIERKRTE